MKVVITGGAGFIGSHLARALSSRGASVTVIDNFRTGLRENLPAGVRTCEADVRDSEMLRAIFGKVCPEIVFHLAAQMNIRRSLFDPVEDADVNIMGGLKVFRESIAAEASRIVFASSGGAVYGEQGTELWEETDAPSPSSPYGIAKLSLEQYGQSFASRSECQFVTLRLANVYGPGQNPLGEAGIVALFMNEMLSRRPPTIFGDGNQTRDFVWIGDVVDAFIRAMTGQSGIYNISTGRECSVRNVFDRLRELLGFTEGPRFVPAVRGEVRRNVLSNRRAREVLGWSPRVSFQQGLAETVRSRSVTFTGHSATSTVSLGQPERQGADVERSHEL